MYTRNYDSRPVHFKIALTGVGLECGMTCLVGEVSRVSCLRRRVVSCRVVCPHSGNHLTFKTSLDI